MTEDDDRDSPRENAGNKLVYLLIGGGIGAILALLFAPKSGQELRADIADATRKGIERSRKRLPDLLQGPVIITKAHESLHAVGPKQLRVQLQPLCLAMKAFPSHRTRTSHT